MTKAVKLELTENEYSRYLDALVIIDVMIASKSFPTFVKSIVDDPNIDVKDVSKKLGIFSKIDGKHKVKIEKSAKRASMSPDEFDESPKEKKETYFTKRIPATERSVYLFNNVSDKDNINIRYDNENYTCQVDIRVLLNAYIKEHNLKKDKIVTPDRLMRSLAPNALQDVNVIRDMKGLFQIVSEIMGSNTSG